MKSIKIKASNGTDCVIFVDKITHITNNGQNSFIHMGETGISTKHEINTIMELINVFISSYDSTS